ncbi:sodium-dependent transporter, partial [bacterium]|nr:sodium-dependent transporter [bacterium]
PLPFLLLAILFFRGVTLPGAIDGLSLYLTPDFSKLGDLNVWKAAYGQIFFSLSVGFGIMIAYASFRPKNADVVNNGFITGLANCGTSFFAGFAVFSVLGYMAQQQGVPVTEVVDSGLGLAFVTFPKAIALLPAGAVAIGIIFFLMLLTLGIDSAFSLVEAASTAFSDEIKIKRHTTTVILCVVGFLAGLLFITDGGLYWLDIVDHWVNDYGLILVAFLEVLFLGWFFNLKSLQVQIDEVSEIKAGMWWLIMIKYVATPVLAVILVWGVINDIRNPYGDYDLIWRIIGGWGLIAVLLIASFIISGIQSGKSKEEVSS